MSWGPFPEYPGARSFTWGHVNARTSHISWHAYATKDSLESVMAFFEREHEPFSRSLD